MTKWYSTLLRKGSCLIAQAEKKWCEESVADKVMEERFPFVLFFVSSLSCNTDDLFCPTVPLRFSSVPLKFSLYNHD
jgi:hypothetical protein